MQKKIKTKGSSKGVWLTVIGGICWGFSGTCGQYLLSNCQLDNKWLTSVRMLTAGIILTFFCLMKKRPALSGMIHDKSSMVRLFLFAIAGLTVCQFTYLTAIKYTNAGTATVLQYIGPIFILIYACISQLRWPKIQEAIAIVLALTGTFLIATGGNIHTMIITKEGLFWGLMSAVSVFLYSTLPKKIISLWGSTVVTGLGMLIGGVVLFVGVRAWSIPVYISLRMFWAMVAIVIIGTVVAFTLYLYGVNELGAVKASMIASVEPVAATIFSAVILGTRFHIVELLGFVCILTTVFLLARK